MGPPAVGRVGKRPGRYSAGSGLLGAEAIRDPTQMGRGLRCALIVGSESVWQVRLVLTSSGPTSSSSPSLPAS